MRGVFDAKANHGGEYSPLYEEEEEEEVGTTGNPYHQASNPPHPESKTNSMMWAKNLMAFLRWNRVIRVLAFAIITSICIVVIFAWIFDRPRAYHTELEFGVPQFEHHDVITLAPVPPFHPRNLHHPNHPAAADEQEEEEEEDSPLPDGFIETLKLVKQYSQMEQDHEFMVNMMPDSVKIHFVEGGLNTIANGKAKGFFELGVKQQTKIAVDVLSKEPTLRKQLEHHMKILTQIKQLKHLNFPQILKSAERKAVAVH